MAVRSTVLNALAMSTFNAHHCEAGPKWFTNDCMPIATDSAAPRTPTPTCRGDSPPTCALATPVESNAFPTNRRRVSPTATGRTPPSDFCSGVRLAPQRYGLWCAGSSPAAHFSVRATRDRTRPRPPPLRRRASWRWDGRKPEGPGALALGNLRTQSLTMVSQNPSSPSEASNGSTVDGSEANRTGTPFGCKALKRLIT